MSSDMVKFFTSTLYLSSECNFHLFLCWSFSDILLSSDWILGLALSYAGCTYETRYWAWPPPMQFEHRVSIGPHICNFGIHFYLPSNYVSILKIRPRCKLHNLILTEIKIYFNFLSLFPFNLII